MGRSRGRGSERLLMLVAVALACRQVVGLAQLRSTLAWLEGGVAAPDTSDSPLDRAARPVAVHFVVPVLREQSYVGDMIAWFASLLSVLPTSTLTVVTTEGEAQERERALTRFASSPDGRHSDLSRVLTPDECTALAASMDATTGIDVASRRRAASAALDRFPTTKDVVAARIAGLGDAGGRVRHAHYTGEGRKAAQVNFAADQLGPGDGYVAVYDVDSRPTLELIQQTLTFVGQHAASAGRLPAVVQQSATFATGDAHPAAWQRFLCRGAARLQTLWTLRREVPSFRRYAAAHRWPSWSRPVGRGLAQTVGHGLLVRTDVFRAVGGLPTYTVLDDLPFGYRLTVSGIDVLPVPQLTTAPAPEDVGELLAQGGRWFHNYLDYPICTRRARSEGAGISWSRGVALGFGVYRGVTWLLRSPGTATAIALLLAPRSGVVTRTASGIALVAGVVLPVQVLARRQGRHLGPGALARESLELLAATLLSSAGPVAAIIERLTVGPPGGTTSPKTANRSPRAPAPATR